MRTGVYAPWYLLLWRLLWWLPAYSLKILFTVVVLIGWGPNAARRAWER